MNIYKAIIVSDLHLGTKDSKTEEFLEFITRHPTELLILNGDIVDGWALQRGSKWKKKHTKVISKLLKLSSSTRIIWIRGNHDEFLKEFIGDRFGGIQIREDFKIEYLEHIEYDNWKSKCYYVFHGDIIDVFITKYRWLAKLGAIGYDLALWINRQYNKFRKMRKLPYQSISKKIKKSIKTATNYVNDFEVTALKIGEKYGCDGVICGHIHQPEDRTINGKRYLNSGDWVENTSAILIDQNGKIHLYKGLTYD